LAKRQLAVVVRATSAPRKRVKVRRLRDIALVRNRPQRSLVGADVRAFQAALRDPFSLAAAGARIPDEFAIPTIPLTVEQVFTVTANGSGEADIVITADPLVSFIDPLSTMTSVGALNSMGAASGHIYGATTKTALAALCDAYRVVSTGIKVRNLMPFNTVTGRVLTAKVPPTGNFAGPVDIAAANPDCYFLVNLISQIGMQANGIINGNILSLPGAQEYTMQDLISQALLIQPRGVTPAWRQFRDPLDDASLGGTGGPWYQNVVFTTGSNPVVAGSTSQRTNGNEITLIRFTGCPVSTLVAEVRVVYRLEAAPPVPTSVVMATPAPPSPIMDNFHSFYRSELLSDVIRLVGDWGVNRLSAMRANARVMNAIM